MNDLIVSFIRTYVPIAVGTFISWLATKGLDIDAQTGQLVGKDIALAKLRQTRKDIEQGLAWPFEFLNHKIRWLGA